MSIVHHQQLVPAHVVHRDQIANRLLERLKRLIVVEVADVLADERLSIDDQRDGV